MIQQAHNNLKKTKQKLTNLENLESPISPTAAPLSQKNPDGNNIAIHHHLQRAALSTEFDWKLSSAIVIQQGLCNA